MDDDLALELARLLADKQWRRDGLCTEPEYSSVEFFPDRVQPAEPAKAVCARCMVSANCLAYALDMGIRDGIWGGTTGRARRKMQSTQREAA